MPYRHKKPPSWQSQQLPVNSSLMRIPVLLHQYDITICAASATAAENPASRHPCFAGKNKGAMDQLELFDLPNPCVGICQSNNRGYCVGCLRSRDERFNWHQKPVAERAKILKLLENRRVRRDAARLAGKPDQGLEADPTPDLFDF